MKNYLLWVTIATSGFSLLVLFHACEVAAQQPSQNTTNIQTNITEQFHQKYSRNAVGAEVNKQYERDTLDFNLDVQVAVEYESPTTILISGYLITDKDLIFNTFLFQGMDLLTNKYGFKVQDVFTSGEGNKANPTRVYILLTK